MIPESRPLKKIQKLAWAVSGSGHYFIESIDIIKNHAKWSHNYQGGFDLFVSKAAQEVVAMYRQKLVFDEMASPDQNQFNDRNENNASSTDQGTAQKISKTQIFRDNTASAPAVGKFYHGDYHGLVVSPATSNSIAKFVYGISDNLVTNVFAQAGKCRVPIIVFACDTAPVMESEAPGGRVTLWPRKIDLENVEKLKSFENTIVVSNLTELAAALEIHYQKLTA